FFSLRKEIEQLYENNPKLGIVGNYLLPNRHSFNNTYRLTSIYPHFTCMPIGYMAVHTFYVMNGHAIHKFLNGCHSDFFTKNIVDELGYDRWFFEANFPAIADMMGYDIQILTNIPVKAHEFMMDKLQEWRRDPVNYKPETYQW
ncbi:MAG: hypothetical protein WCP55_03720, partial [Lentisphaerota bacterium]